MDFNCSPCILAFYCGVKAFFIFMAFMIVMIFWFYDTWHSTIKYNYYQETFLLTIDVQSRLNNKLKLKYVMFM